MKIRDLYITVKKVTPPYTNEDKQDILTFCEAIVKNKITVDEAYTGFSEEEAIALLLPQTNWDYARASYFLKLVRGEESEEFMVDGEVYERLWL